MNIQIFGKKKCFDTKKAERWFKERRIKFQQIDLVRFGMSGGEFDSVLRAMGGVDALIDWSVKSPEIDLLRYTDDRRAKEDKLFDHPELMGDADWRLSLRDMRSSARWRRQRRC